jgi:RHS repeat-associated protein
MTGKVLNGGTWEYQWTAENRLSSVSKNLFPVASMRYDEAGQRIQKIYSPPGEPRVITTYIGKIYEKRTYADGSPERHTLHLYGNGQLLMSWTRSGNIQTAANDSHGWRAEIAAASLYSPWSMRGAGRKLAHFGRAWRKHPAFVPASRLAGFFALSAIVFWGLLRRPTRHARRLRLATVSVLLVFGGAGQWTAARPMSGSTTSGPGIGKFYYHRNHVNSSAVITDVKGNEVSRLNYLPFGEVSQANSTGADVVTSKYTGQESDEEFGLYYYNARYYDPSIGRFISADSIVPHPTNAQSYNRYSYTENNPVSRIDPSGHGGCGPSDLGPYCPSDYEGVWGAGFQIGWGAAPSQQQVQQPGPARAAAPTNVTLPTEPSNNPDGVQGVVPATGLSQAEKERLFPGLRKRSPWFTIGKRRPQWVPGERISCGLFCSITVVPAHPAEVPSRLNPNQILALGPEARADYLYMMGVGHKAMGPKEAWLGISIAATPLNFAAGGGGLASEALAGDLSLEVAAASGATETLASDASMLWVSV